MLGSVTSLMSLEAIVARKTRVSMPSDSGNFVRLKKVWEKSPKKRKKFGVRRE